MKSMPGYQSGAVTLILLNLHQEMAVEIDVTGTSGTQLGTYLVTADQLSSATVNLNGQPMTVSTDGTPMETEPRWQDGSTLSLPPTSIAFVTIADAGASACP